VDVTGGLVAADVEQELGPHGRGAVGVIPHRRHRADRVLGMHFMKYIVATNTTTWIISNMVRSSKAETTAL
jgi:hypothetical protein